MSGNSRIIEVTQLESKTFLALDTASDQSAEGFSEHNAALNLIRNDPQYGVTITDLTGNGLGTPTRTRRDRDIVIFSERKGDGYVFRAKISGDNRRGGVCAIDAETAVFNLISGNPQIFGLDLGHGGSGHEPMPDSGDETVDLYTEFTVEQLQSPPA